MFSYRIYCCAGRDVVAKAHMLVRMWNIIDNFLVMHVTVIN